MLKGHFFCSDDIKQDAVTELLCVQCRTAQDLCYGIEFACVYNIALQ